MCLEKKSIWFCLGVIMAALGLVYWYSHLPKSRKLFYRNLVSQIPDMPNRYFV